MNLKDGGDPQENVKTHAESLPDFNSCTDEEKVERSSSAKLFRAGKLGAVNAVSSKTCASADSTAASMHAKDVPEEDEASSARTHQAMDQYTAELATPQFESRGSGIEIPKFRSENLKSHAQGHCSDLMVGPEGGSINLGGCAIKVSENTFPVLSEITFAINVDLESLNLPPGVIVVTPVVDIRSKQQPAKLIDFGLPALCQSISEPLPIDILGEERSYDGKIEWKKVPAESLSLAPSKDFLQFRSDHFCKFVGVTQDAHESNVSFPLSHYFGQNGEEFIAIFCKSHVIAPLNVLNPLQMLEKMCYKCLHIDEYNLTASSTQISVELDPPNGDLRFEPGSHKLNKDRFHVGNLKTFRFVLESAGKVPSKFKLKYKVEENEAVVVTHLDERGPPTAEPSSSRGIEPRKVLWDEQTMSRTLYQLADEIGDGKWTKFARCELGLSNSEIDTIKTDHAFHTEEQKYQMLSLWLKRNGGATEENVNKLQRMKDRFFHPPK